MLVFPRHGLLISQARPQLLTGSRSAWQSVRLCLVPCYLAQTNDFNEKNKKNDPSKTVPGHRGHTSLNVPCVNSLTISVSGKDDIMAGNNGNASQFLAPPTVAALREEARISSQHQVAMGRSFSEDMQAEREDLREAAEETLNVILDLGLDGHIKWVSPSWRHVIGTDPESVEGKVISDVLWTNKFCFQDAIKSMKEDDSRSRFIRFSVAMGADSILKSSIKESSSTIKDADSHHEGEANKDSAGDGESDKSVDAKEQNGEDILDMEAQGIMIYDRSGDGEGHAMWMLRPSTSPKEVTIDLPPLLVESLGVGAEVLANHLTVLAERAAGASADKSVTPTPVLCRICERQITPWWFEKHSELCLQEHTAELEVQIAQENLNEHRHAIVKVLDALEARQGRSFPTDTQQPTPQPEYKGLPIGPSPSSSLSSSAPGSSPATPPRSRDPSTSGLGHGRGRSFAVRRPLARIVELILDLCDTALEISTPALKETRTDCIEDLRTLSPQSESRICQVLQWQSPSSNMLEQEQGLAALSADTEQAAKAKVDAVVRHRRIVEYAERIRVEYAVMVEECIDAALSKAERIAAGDLSDSTSTTGSYDSEGEQVRTVDQINEEDEQQTSQDTESNAALSLEHSSDVATRESDPSPLSQSPRRGSSVAVSTRSASPLECPTPRSHKSISGILGTFQPIKRGSLLAESDIGENSDGSSVPSSSLIAATRVSESPSSEKGISHSSSGRSTKRKSLILPNLSSSPRRQASPGRAPGSGSPLRLSKPRLPSGESMPSPSISPLLTTNELTSQGLPPHHQLHTHHHHHHRRQSSTASSDPRAPISPHLSSVSQPQPRPAPPSIKDFEIIKPISKGAFGSVYLSKKKTTGEYFAIKVLKKADMVAKNQVTNVKAERAIMMWQGESDFVAKLYWTFSSKDYLYLVMEYLNGGDCASLVKILGGLPEDWAKKYIAEVVLGVEHLHNRGIVHRDLKPDNLLIDPRGHLKLTDFGLSRMGLVGRQKRVLKSPNESAPDLLKQGPFPRAMSLVSSRSASFDFQGGHSPSSTPIITPDTAGSYNQPSYFSLSQLPPPRESLGRASGYRSDSGGSDTLNAMFRTFSLSEGAETPAPLPSLSQAVTEDEAPSEGGESPHLIPLSQTVSATSSAVHNTPPTQSMLPPPMALFDPEDHNRRFVGTPDYLAPETINGVGQDEMSDWWSLGCILFEFLYGYPPFNAATPDQVFENILHRRINWPDEAQELVSSEAIDLMNKLMTIDPQQRLGANIEEKFPNGGAEIRSHPWFADVNWDTLLEDKAEFVPNPENPEDTEYFDARGATLQSFEELEDAPSPQYPMTAGEYPDRPHDALSRVRSQVNSMKRGLMPLHIPPHVRDTRSRRLSEPVLADDFGNFNFKNLPMLERANKDVIQRLRQEAMQAQQRQIPSSSASPSVPSSTPSLEGSPLLPMPLQRTLSQTKGNRPVSPSGLSQTGSSPNRPSQPSSPLLVQFSTGQNHERRKTSGSSSAQSQQSVGSLSEKFGEGVPRLTASAKLASSAPTSNKPGRLTTHSPEKTASGLPQSGITRARSQTIGSQDSEGHSVSSKDPFIPSHHKRRSQLFDISPSSSDNEDPRTKALLKVQRRRQSTRRLSQINLLDGPVFRPLDILICEDHPVSRLVMERLFEKLRCRTITAVNGSEAIRYALSEVQFDIIMTEVKLPQINGADVARMIRETRSANRHTPIIAVTGYLKDLPETHHFNALIEKPPTLNKLTEALSTFCQWKAPPKDYVPTHSLMIPPPIPRGINHTEDSPSSISSGFHPVPSSSYRGSSRADSVGSSYFGDMESNKAEEIPVVISRHTDSWGDTSEGLGILEGAAAPAVDPKLNTNFPSSLSLSPLQHAFSAPPTSNPPSLIVPRKQRSSEAIRAKRESLEKRRYEGAESGDDEDEELGNFQTRHRAPHTSKGARSSSKLGTEMMRTNSRGSVVSGSEEILAKESAAESGAGDVHDLEEQLGAFDMSLDEASSPERRYSKPESPRSSRSPDHIRRPTLEPLHEYPTEIRSPDSSDLRAQSLTMGISTPSKEGTTNGGDASLGQIGTTSGDPTDSEGMDPDATPRPAPTPDMSELDDTTPRGSVKGRHEGNQERPGGQTGHIHLRDVLHWRRR